MVVCKDIHTIYYRPSLQYYTKQGRFHVPAYCYQCISYGRKLRTTVYNWWQLYICFFPIPFVFTNRNCHTHLYCESAYKSLGKAHSFYDGMMTCSTLMGRFVTKIVWNMNREDALEYQSRSFEMIPADFNGKLLEVPLGTGVLSMPIWKTLPNADITCLDYSENMMVSASQRADEMGIKNISFPQGDVGDLPFEDNTFDVVVSLNGFHAFPDKEAAFRETYRVLKPGGIFTGCFYVEGSNLHTDKMINRFYIKSGFFTKPFDTITSLEQRLKNLYHDVIVSNVESIAIFQCRKG